MTQPRPSRNRADRQLSGTGSVSGSVAVSMPVGGAAGGDESPVIGTVRLRGARVHNLRGIDLDLPHNRLIVVTGVSGSGKSSLVFDTLFAEGQRRFLESLSFQTRALLSQLEPPDVDLLEGLPPTLAVHQHPGSVQSRSTVATLTEIHDHLRLLFARVGVLHCPRCDQEVTQQSTQQIVESLLALEEGRKVMLLSPLVQGRKGEHRELFESIAKQGFVRARVDGELVDVANPPALKKTKPHTIEVVIDRLVIKPGLRSRLHDSVQLAVKHGNGLCVVAEQDERAPGGFRDRLLSTRWACAACQISFPTVEPRLLSFNSPYGACPECGGLGVVLSRKPEPKQAPHRASSSATSDGKVLPHDGTPCPECAGTRLNETARHIRWGGTSLPEFLAWNLADALAFCRTRERECAAGGSPADQLALKILPELIKRLEFLVRVGLDYLTLDRPAPTLSGGELQRTRLAGCLGTALTGVCYVLDEPTAGLHARDTARLVELLQELRDQGNTVIVVEHDLEVLRQADLVVDLGPGAGREGGRIVAMGTPDEIAANATSLTGQALRARSAPSDRRPSQVSDQTDWLTLSHLTRHNLRDLSVRIPLGCLTAITGVSGSGKSTLIWEGLVPALKQRQRERERGGAVTDAAGRVADDGADGETSLTGDESLRRLVEVDQSPLGRTSRSNPATASGLWTEIRKILTRTKEARLRGFGAARFSLTTPQGRCPECRGLGERRLAMQFLPDVWIPCATCRGRRFNRGTLQVRFKGLNAADLLALRIDEALPIFSNFDAIHAVLATFVDVGLGYLTLGQSATSLSGGEAQRIKLVAELGAARPEATLFVLDEPTTGLHACDVTRLIGILRRLVDQGHTVVVIEHHPDLIAHCDWRLNLGPGSGPQGGTLTHAGPP